MMKEINVEDDCNFLVFDCVLDFKLIFLQRN